MPQPISNTIQQGSTQGLLGSIGGGISNFASNIGQGLSGLIQLPGALINQGKSSAIASNTQAAASGQPYIPNYTGGYSGQGILTPGTLGTTGITSQATSFPSQNVSSTVPSSSSSSGLLPMQATPGQTYQQYEAAQGFPQGTPTQPTSQNTPNQGLGTGGGAAPEGMSYNGQGQLVPTSSLPTGTSPQTFNTNPYNATAPTYSGAVGALTGTASQPSAAFTQAQQTAQTALQQLEASQANEANANAANQSNPIPLEFQQGRGQVLQNQYNAQQQALANEYQGAVGLEGAATNQQGTQQSGLAGAAGLSAPQAANPYGTYSPTTEQYSQYGGGTGGGAATAGGVQTQVQQGAAVQQMTGQQAQAQTLAQNLNQLITSAGINPASPGNSGPLTSYVNGALQWINNNTGDPQYQNFANLIGEISSRYASILNQSGGTPTDQFTLSHTIINSLASGQSIQQVLQSLDKNATDSINALKGASQNNANNGPTSTSTNATSQYSW